MTRGVEKTDRTAIVDALVEASIDELCEAVLEFGLTERELCEKFAIDTKQYYDEGFEAGQEDADKTNFDVDGLCRAIAEGRTRDALAILYEDGVTGTHPKNHMRLADLWRTA